MLVAAAGPVVDVSMSNAVSLLLCSVVLARTWRDTDWRSVLTLALPAVAVIPLGALVVRAAPEGPLPILVGTMVVLAVSAAALAGQRRLLRGTTGAIAAGALSGFMSVTAGVGGPMVSVYALSEQWTRRALIPTRSLPAHGERGVPRLQRPPVGVWFGWACSGMALVIGAVAGEWLDRRIAPDTGRRLIVVIALAGGVAAAWSVASWRWCDANPNDEWRYSRRDRSGCHRIRVLSYGGPASRAPFHTRPCSCGGAARPCPPAGDRFVPRSYEQLPSSRTVTMPQPTVQCTPCGHTPDGEPVERWILTSASGVRANVLTYGAILHTLDVLDSSSCLGPVVLGTATAVYASSPPGAGAVAPRGRPGVPGPRSCARHRTSEHRKPDTVRSWV
ncbi:TSUP family transporter [Streptomyces sp. NA02950]|uniref:sulfite exporter TauE/SafE family protein n=1 Tax=Streptomyces sp. NA02950 TaxID=2742137 RepID=UPI0015920942|nr:TSUP family transporter [Streptomyces sp. NA02950]